MNAKPAESSPKSQLYGDIIERIEYVRKLRGLNKSKFSAAIGMKPQTYNNFIGAQGSKPNVELIYGVVSVYEVNPYWLLQGEGAIFSSEAATQSQGMFGEAMMVHEGGRGEPRLTPEAYRELRRKLEEVDPLVQELEERLREVEISQRPMLKSLVGLLSRYMQADPNAATKEIKTFLERLRKKFDVE